MIDFRPEFLDFRRGIRVGKLEDNQRITRILKLSLEERFGEAFITERYGRGMYWRWIGLLPRSNRLAKALSSDVSFGCAKFFIMIDVEEAAFKCGLQVERGFVTAPAERRAFVLREDWDWHRLVKRLRKNSPLEAELTRLITVEGFQCQTGTLDEPVRFTAETWSGAPNLRRSLQRAAGNDWAGLQVFYPMTEQEVGSTNGLDLVESMLAVFDEVTPLMNGCMQVELTKRTGEPHC